MKKIFLCLIIGSLIVACHSHDHPHDAENKHAHDEHGNHITPEEPALEPLVYTLYTNKTELFVEFQPLITGTESRFAAHFTALGELFTAIDTGSVTLSLIGSAGTQAITANAPEVPGIFRLRMTPEKTGDYNLIFKIVSPAYTDTVTIENVRVYPDANAAMSDQPSETGSGSDITYLKEQAWKVEFANAPAQVQPFSEIIRTSGRIISAPGDEAVLTSQIGGIITFSGSGHIPGSAIASGSSLFTIKSNEVVQSNLSADVTKAEADVDASKKNFDRANELVKDKIISEREFIEAKLRYEQAQTQLNAVKVNRSFNSNRQNVTAPIGGFLKNITVENGQYVSAGQPLATISKNKKLLLQAEVSQKYFPKLSAITSANFKIPGNDAVFNTRQLNGRLMSYGKSADANSPFIPVTFEIDNVGNFIPGSVVEVFLQSTSTPALIIPVSALLEEQGIFYVYVQTEGESFQKREVKIGASDGLHVQVLSGVTDGERVVTEGAYQIKLSTASGTLPAHGHEH